MQKTIQAIYKQIVAKHKLIERPQQSDMLNDCYKAMSEGKIALLESATGTGKTLSLLLSAAAMLVSNKKKGMSERVTIATPQKNLQKQMIEEFNKYIATEKAFADIKIALLKGRNNYISVAEIEKLIEQYEEDEETKARIADFVEYVDRLGGDIDLIENEDPDQIPDFVDVQSLALPISASSAKNEKYYEQAKKEASDADIIVTNHHMLLYSTLNPQSIIAKDNIIIDEAHTFISNAYSFLKKTVAFRSTQFALDKILYGLEREPFRGSKKLAEEIKAVRTMIGTISERLTNNVGKKISGNLFYIKQCGEMNPMRQLVDVTQAVVHDLTTALAAVKKNMDKYKRQYGDHSLNAYAKFADICDACNQFKYAYKETADRDSYYVITFSDTLDYPSLAKVTPKVAHILYNGLWKNMRSAILVSGTLADISSSYETITKNRLAASFWHIKNELGLNIKKDMSFIEYAYKKPFDWQNVHVYLYPDAPKFEIVKNGNGANTKMRQALADYASDRIIKSIANDDPLVEGGAMALMAAYEDLNMLSEKLKTGQKVRKIVAQSANISVSKCVAKLKRAPKKTMLVMVGGWEGVDFPGQQLTDLFIIRIPHANPEDPQVMSRKMMTTKRFKDQANYRSLRGKDYGRHMQFANKAAYLGIQTEDFWRFRQGLGRVIRHENDRGNIHIFDSRICDDSNEYHKYLQREFKKIELR